MPTSTGRGADRQFRRGRARVHRGAGAAAEAARCVACGGCSECRLCVDACEAEAIDHDMKDEMVSIDVGSIIVATGFDALDPTPMSQYGYGSTANVFTNLEFERLSNATGPTARQDCCKRDPEDRFKFTEHAEERGDPALHRQPRHQLPRVLLAHLLHVRAQVRPPAQGQVRARHRGLQLLHRHALLRKGLRGVLQARPGAKACA